MSDSVLPLELQRVGKSLFVRPHKVGQLLESAPLASNQRGGRMQVISISYLDEQLPVFRVHVYCWGCMGIRYLKRSDMGVTQADEGEFEEVGQTQIVLLSGA